MTTHTRSQLVRHGLVLVAILALLAGMGSHLRVVQVARAATTITVTTTSDELNTDGDCALREAIRAVNLDTAVDACPAGSGNDSIMLPAGTFSLTIAGMHEDASATGDLDITASVTLTGAGADQTVIDGQALDRVVEVHAGVVHIAHVTIQHGREPLGGGGIRNVGQLSVDHIVVQFNESRSVSCPEQCGSFGGGIDSYGPLTIDHSVIRFNQADNGGGVQSTSPFTVQRSLVHANSAIIYAGGILANGQVTVVDSIISDNSTEASGGGIVTGPHALILRSTIRGNGTSGIVNFNDLTIVDSTVSGNTARGDGGGIYNTSSGTLTVLNSSVSGNVANDGGGGILNDGIATLNNVTIADNDADRDQDGIGAGGGISVLHEAVTLRNTLVAGNSDADGQTPDCAGPLASQGYNLIGDASGCIVGGTITGNLVGVDPLLGPLEDNGGPTATHLLMPGSPAIDAGNPAAPGSGGAACEATDQRGITRPHDGDGDGTARCDIGAVEIEPTSTVIPVIIDIKPGSTTNPINVTSKGVIPVAILSTASFDATTVDQGSICFGDAQEASQRDCTEKHGKGHHEDVNGDGLLDLVLHYEMQQTGIDRGDTTACLTGETTDGVPVQGCDTIRAR